MRRVIRLSLLAIVVAVFGVLAGAKPIQALSNLGPDPNDFIPQFAGATFAYGVSSVDHEFAAIPQTRVFLYFKNNTGTKTVTVIGGDTCTDRQNSALNGTGGNYWDRPYKPNPPGAPAVPPAGWPSFNEPVTRFSVTSGQFVYGNFSDSNTCFQDERAIVFPGASLAFDASTGLYKTALTAVMVPGWSNAQNHFQLRLSDADGVIGYDAGLSENSVSLLRYNRDPSQNANGYSDYLLPFAPDCTIGTSATASGYWYDDDNDSPSTQPERFWMQLQKYRIDNGAYVGTVPLTFIGAADVDPGPAGANSYYVNSGNRQNVRMDFTAESGYKYIWRWNHVFHRNVLQFRLPYDSVYFVTGGCQAEAATLRPSSVVDKPKISYPDTANFTHYLNVTNFVHNGAVNYTVQRYRNGNPIGGAQNGNYNFTGNGQFTLLTNTFNSGAGDAGDRICERLTLSTPAGQDLDLINNPSETCTEVMARPYLTATNNDVWAGSRFDYANTQCAGQTPRLSSISSWVSGGQGAAGEYGIFGLGPVTDFGSAGEPGGSRLSFANMPSLGSYGGVTRCIPDYYHTIGASGDAWTGFGSLTENGGKKRFFVNGDLTLDAGQIPNGVAMLLIVNGNLTIRGNITYDDRYNDQFDIASLWAIVQGNIYVQENVTNLQGLYVAQGTSAQPGKIHTCVRTNTISTYNPLTTAPGRCDQPLDIFGAVLADQIYWQRTRGTAGTGTYAESVQFDPGLYLNTPWANPSLRATEVENLSELPPIY